MMQTENYDEETLWNENRKRGLSLWAKTRANPINGTGSSGRRRKIRDPETGKVTLLPVELLADKAWQEAKTDEERSRVRCHHDFEYWAATCVTIKDKLTGRDKPFVLNVPQRRVAGILEKQRRAGEPLRVIMLKARQWGGSTLVQMYMAWIQTVHRENWHSLICAHVKDTSSTIRGMYTKMLSHYPAELWEGSAKPKFTVFEQSGNIRTIAGRNCRVTLGSSENQDAVRGSDFAMAHLSEVAFWSDTRMRTPEGFIRAICGAITMEPLTLIVMESTANGMGNFFHTEWLRACSPEGSDKTPVFVPWYEIPIYSKPVKKGEVMELWRSLDDYERALWHRGLTLEQVKWYKLKRREYPSHHLMMAEYPTTDSEAFANTGNAVFAAADIERLRLGCREPVFRGELEGQARSGPHALEGLHAVSDAKGELEVWSFPPDNRREVWSGRYIVTVDVGGRSASSDYSVIAVLDRGAMATGGLPEFVAQWRGHIDHDLLAWKSAAIATWYGNALLVIESNTLETETATGSDGASGSYLLARLSDTYTNMYRRVAPDSGTRMPQTRIGFHTNRVTKSLVISELIAQVRDGSFVERSQTAVNEMAVYQLQPNGVYEAARGHHDDVLMTRAIGLYVSSQDPPVVPRDASALLRGWGCCGE